MAYDDMFENYFDEEDAVEKEVASAEEGLGSLPIPTGITLPTGAPIGVQGDSNSKVEPFKQYNQEDVAAMLSGMDDTQQAMRDAVERRAKRERMVGILRGLSKIGTAMSGAKQDDAGWDALQKETGNEVRDLQDIQKQKLQDLGLKKAAYEAVKMQDQIDKGNFDKAILNKMADPGSDVSKMYREVAAKKYQVTVPENVSAHELHNWLLKFAKTGDKSNAPFQQTTLRDPKTGVPMAGIFDPNTGTYKMIDGMEKTGVNPAVREDPHTKELRPARDFIVGSAGANVTEAQQAPYLNTPQQTTAVTEEKSSLAPQASPSRTPEPEEAVLPYHKLNVKQKEYVDKANDELIKDDQVKAAGDAIEGAKGALQLLEFGEKNKGDIKRAIQNMLARATGERGVMTEQDVAPFGGEAALLSRLNSFLKYNTLGEIPQSDRKFLKAFARTLEQAGNNRLYRATKPKMQELKRQLGNINPSDDQIKTYLNLNSRFTMPPKLVDPAIEKYAKDNKMPYAQAKELLMKRGHTPKEE